jgi:hypothetical protein
MAVNLAGFIAGAFIARDNGVSEEEAATFGLIGALFPSPLLGAAIVQGLTDTSDGNDTQTATEIITVKVPKSTPSGKTVYLSGNLSVLDSGLPDWLSNGILMTQVSHTRWTAELTGPGGANLEYRFTLGDSDSVERDFNCDEIPPRRLALPTAGTREDHADKVANWGGIGDCAPKADSGTTGSATAELIVPAPAPPAPARSGRAKPGRS